jgi:hypothetical protein
MERKLNKKIEGYCKSLKEDIREKCIELKLYGNEVEELINYIYNYPSLSFDPEDLKKRKRVKNSVPVLDRCLALRATCEQCTRRKKDGFEYCGTHIKGTPHGIIEIPEGDQIQVEKIQVWTEDICGILYYIDSKHNVYKTEDIVQHFENPKVIGKWKIQDTKYVLYCN